MTLGTKGCWRAASLQHVWWSVLIPHKMRSACLGVASHTPTLCSIEDMSKVPKSMQWPRTQLWKSLKQENSCSGNQVWTETSARCLLRFLLHWATSSPPITKSLCGIQLNCQEGLAQSGRLRVFSQTQLHFQKACFGHTNIHHR